MRSIGARLALWYAGVSTATLVLLFFGGYYLLSYHLINALDVLNRARFEQIKSVLGSENRALDRTWIEEHMRSLTTETSVQFYVQIHGESDELIFSSPNLSALRLPDMAMPGRRVATVTLDGIGEVRLGEFSLQNVHVTVGTSLGEVRKAMEGYTETSLILVCLMLVVSIITGLVLSRAAMRPVRLIQETAHHIRSDNLSQRIPVADVQDEISNLARLLNEMFDRLELSFNQIRRFTAEASHELKTPLSLVRLQAEKLLTEGGLTASQEEAVQVQLEEIARLNKIIEELLFLSRAEAHAVRLDFQRENPSAFMQSFAQDAHDLAKHRGMSCTTSIQGQGRVDFDSKWLRQVLLNLVQNALNASPPNGQIFLSSDFTIDAWRVAIEDQGPGVPRDQQERIFERFVRLESSSVPETKGSGLGLAISRSIIGLHHGRIRAETPARGIGLRVVFELPLADMRAVPAPAASQPPAHESGTVEPD